jgi:hypothetical protein
LVARTTTTPVSSSGCSYPHTKVSIGPPPNGDYNHPTRLDGENESAGLLGGQFEADDTDRTRIPKLNLGLPGHLLESELPALITSRTERVFGFFGSNPSPGPPRLMTTPAAGHPLPKGEGGQRGLISALSLGERVARVASRVRGLFPQSLATSEFGLKKELSSVGRK